MSVISQWELKTHPEFPHPSSKRFRVLKSGQELDEEEDEEDNVQEYSYDSSAGDRTNVSVYIPSCPATRFWIRYAISPDCPPARFFYFKLYLNGRHVTSWGTNPKKTPKGQVMRALFNPELEHNAQSERLGIQARQFFFADHKSYGPSARDGGLIEVRCFRAKGRRRVAPAPGDFRGGQEGYGLDLPKGDMLGAPEDTHFYDWHLMDPKDLPYARFKFHYRTWDSLQALCLIPTEVPQPQLTRTSSIWSITKAEENKLGRVQGPFHQPEGLSDSGKRSQGQVTSNVPALHQTHDKEEYQNRPVRARSIHLNQNMSSDQEPYQTNNYNDTYPRRSSLSDRPPTPLSVFSELPQFVPTPQRPVPTPRKRELQRTSSTVSLAVSITPSLYSYIDREGCDSPEPYLGVAAAVPFSSYGDDRSITSQECSQFPVISPDSSPNPFRRSRASYSDEASFQRDQFPVLSPSESGSPQRFSTRRTRDSYDDEWSLMSEAVYPTIPVLPPQDDEPHSFSARRTRESYAESEECSQYPVIPPLQVDEPRHFPAQRTRSGIERPPEAMFSPASVAALVRDIDIRYSSASPVRDHYADRFRYDHEEELAKRLSSKSSRRSSSPGRCVSPGQSEAYTEYMSALEEQDEDEITEPHPGDSFLGIPSSTKIAHERVRAEGMEEESSVYHDALEYGKSEDQTSTPAPVTRPRARSKLRIRTWL